MIEFTLDLLLRSAQFVYHVCGSIGLYLAVCVLLGIVGVPFALFFGWWSQRRETRRQEKLFRRMFPTVAARREAARPSGSKRVNGSGE